MTETKNKKLLIQFSGPGHGAGATDTAGNVFNHFGREGAIRIPAGGKIQRAMGKKLIELRAKNEGDYSITEYREFLAIKKDDGTLLDFLKEAIENEFNNPQEKISEEDYKEIYLKEMRLEPDNENEVDILDQITDQLPLTILSQIAEESPEIKVVIDESNLGVTRGDKLEKELFEELKISEKYTIIKIVLIAQENAAAWRVLYREIENDKLEYKGENLGEEAKKELLKLLLPFMNCDSSPDEIAEACDEASTAFDSFNKSNPELAIWFVEQFEAIFKSNADRMKEDEDRWIESLGISLRDIVDAADHVIDTTNKSRLGVFEDVLRIIMKVLRDPNGDHLKIATEASKSTN